MSETKEKREKELSTKGHEERRRATKALRLTATGYQGHERIVDFRLFCSRMIRTAGRGRPLPETIEGFPQRPKKEIHEGPLSGWRKLKRDPPKVGRGEKISTKGVTVSVKGVSLLQNLLGSGIYCREELLFLGARASRPHKTWQGRGDWLHRVSRFTRRLTLEQRLDKYAGGTPALPGGNPWLARCRSLSRALFCRSILPPSHARLRILQKARVRD